MYKQNNKSWIKHLDFILLDMLSLLFSLFLAYYCYNKSFALFQDDIYRNLAIVLLVLDAFVCILFNTMHNVLHRKTSIEFGQTVKQTAALFGALMFFLFAAKFSIEYSRVIIFLTAILYLVISFLTRLLWKRQVLRHSKKKKKRKMILVCREEDVPRVLERSSSLNESAFVGVVLTDRDAKGTEVCNLPVVANLSDAADYICREWVDEVFVYPEHLTDLKMSSYEAIEAFIDDTYGTKPKEAEDRQAEQSGVARLIEQCREMAIPVHIRLPITSAGGKSFIEKVGGYNVLTMTANYASPGQLIAKRILDILGGIVGSIAALFIIAIIGPKIKKESPGPILFRQTRIGQNGKRFTFYKIRSMYMDAEERKKELQSQNRNADGMMFKLDFDPRIIGNKVVNGEEVTGIGEKIRKTSLDEFPQFFNVLKGDMSLVGTRPPTVDEWEKYKYHHRARLATKPGMTGMWQVSGRSSITDFEEVVKLDTEYINNWSIGLDMKILLKTIKAVIKKDGAM